MFDVRVLCTAKVKLVCSFLDEKRVIVQKKSCIQTPRNTVFITLITILYNDITKYIYIIYILIFNISILVY